MPAEWRINFWPECESHVFLSHCAEDRDALVDPVCKALTDRGIVPWMDRYDYPLARGGLDALHEDLLKCRHVVYFITPAMLRQGRGWASAERALTAAIQQELSYLEEIAHVELPLLFVPQDDSIFVRSIWRSLVDKTSVCPHRAPRTCLTKLVKAIDLGERLWARQHVDWATHIIESFIRQEEEWAFELADRIGHDNGLRASFSHDRNLFGRILAASPPPLPLV